MKILFAGDASNMHNCLATQLKRMGHTAVVVSDGSRWMDTGRDINLTRRPGRWGAVQYAARLLRQLPLWRGYDVVELASPIFFKLRPERLQWVLDWLRRHNRMVVLSALGTDYVYYTACHDGHTFRYSDYRIGNEPSPYVLSSEYIAQHQDNWKLPVMRRYSDHVTGCIDGAVACLYEYWAAYRPVLPPDRLAYAGIPIDTSSLTPSGSAATAPQSVRFFIGIQRDRNVIKGTDRLLAALKRVHDRYPRECQMEVVESLPYAEYVSRMRASHVILDQLYSYTPATNALIAMAQGLVAVSGAEPEYYQLIGERDNHPIVNVDPIREGDIDARLEWLVRNRAMLPQLSRQSREFVLKHNAAAVVAQRYLDFWQRLLDAKQ